MISRNSTWGLRGTLFGDWIYQIHRIWKQLEGYDDKSWFGKGYIYRNYILPIFFAGAVVSEVPAGRLCGSYWSAYGFFCLPCSILFVIAASIIGVKASANSDVMYFFTSAQDGDPLQDDVRLCLGDDLKKAQDHNTLIDSSPKFDYLLEEFSGELAHINPIPPGIEEADFDLDEEIHLVKNLSYDNSSPRSLEELNAEIAKTIVKSLSPSPIPVEDSDSHMEEVDLFLATGDSMSPGIENDDYDSEGDIRSQEELLSNDSLPLPEIESSNLDHFNDPSSPRPPPEPPDVEICLNFEPDAGILTTKMVKGISEHYVLMPNILPTLPTLDPDSDFTPSHDSLGSRNKIFDLGIFIEV
ncbi:hypothetical protein Tco_0806098 [Tanacetum coccineum]